MSTSDAARRRAGVHWFLPTNGDARGIVGSAHGLLFVAFCWALLRAAIACEWPLRRSLLAFVASLLPFGTFVFDRSLKREILAARVD